MTNVNTDEVTLSIADETAGPPYGVLPGTQPWTILEPNTISKFGPQVKTIARTPISKNLQRLKGKTVDLDSGVTFQSDIDMEILARMLPATLFAKYTGPGKLADGDVYRPTAVTGTGYTVAANGDVADGTLIYASGFTHPENNGLKVTAGTSTGTSIKTTGLVAESPTGGAAGTAADSLNCTVAVCGVQGVATDLSITVSGSVTKLHSAGGINFTQLGLRDGQFIYIGGTATNTFFGTAAKTFARIAKNGITATDLTLEKDSPALVADAGTSKTIQVFFGRFCTNVARDDAKYLFQTMTVEATYPGLDGGVDEFHYAEGNAVDQCTLDFPITNKGTVEFVLVGTDTPPPTTSRDANASEAREPVQIDDYNTSSEIMRLRVTQVDETPLTVDFESCKLTIKNNVSPKKVLGTLGAKYLNRGYIEASVESTILFTDDQVLADIRANTTDTWETAFRNADGQAFAVDFPSCTLTDGAPTFTAHDQVSLKITLDAFRDTTFGYSLSFSLFPYISM